MNCRSCEYPLWNLAVRTCPECGAPFKPSDFEFVPNSVRFCCPHCRTAYYGTAKNGHLVPPSFTCTGCGKPLSMDACVLLPAEGVRESQTRPAVHPWFDPARRWRFDGWVVAMVRSLFTPRELMRMVPPGASHGFLYGWFVATASSWLALAWVFLVPLLILATSSGPVIRALTVAGWIVMAMVAELLVIGAALLAWIALAHVGLLVTGGASRGMARTSQAICFTAPVTLVMVIPCLGAYLSVLVLPWWVICAGAAVAVAQGTSLWRGLLVTAGPPLAVATVATIILLLR